ncbi:hypothetical protein SLEP1_g15806 [Rubroshorea leprosula]|uniref:Uncharacterized protein n=1 Tax=Rubroshorea leprosula TaxID=152421 RepID=A0AAV5INN2_9ROSI|nr:hypothetical protein SLEP1_g15806 [Rubroshorea leprosula]
MLWQISPCTRNYGKSAPLLHVIRITPLLMRMTSSNRYTLHCPLKPDELALTWICGEFFAKLSDAIASQLFVFFLCNVIIVTLLAKSSKLSTENLEDNNAKDELYEEVIRNTENCQLQSSEDAGEHSIEEIDLEMQGNLASDLDSDSNLDMDNPNSYRRSKSEKFVRPGVEKGKRKKGMHICFIFCSV